MGKAVFSPDGTRLAGVGPAGTIRIWHLATGALHTVRTGRGTTVRSMAFSPDGRTLAAVDIGSAGDRVTLLDTTTGRIRHTLTPNAGGPLSVAFSRDGRTLASASGRSLQTWDTRTGRLRESLGAGGEVGPAAFSADGRTVAVSGTTGVELWDLATARLRATLPTRSPTPAAFSPDGHTLAVGTADSVALWTVDLPDPAEAIHTICEAAAPTAPDCGPSGRSTPARTPS
jgi:WD40 repeat protein